MKLTSEQLSALHHALLSAFPVPGDLNMLVRFGMGVNLDEIVGPGNLRSRMFDLLVWAQAQNKVADLLRQAKKENPENPDLKRVLSEWDFFGTTGGKPRYRPTEADYTTLVTLLDVLYPGKEQADALLARAGLTESTPTWEGDARRFWNRLVEKLSPDNLQRLAKAASKQWPSVDWQGIARQTQSPTVGTVPSSPEAVPQGTYDQLEQITGNQSTFLPVWFLERGLEAAKSIVKIATPKGSGSGCLIAGDLLLTNNHVIPTRDIAQSCLVQFNYQQTMEGLDEKTDDYKLDPAAVFATSEEKNGDDWTVVKIAGEPSQKWPHLKLSNCQVNKDDYVNIIQHPGGLQKQVALYHNIVVGVDQKVVQYMTDTMPGSSGAPVFDSNWRVVAIHHAGGWLQEPDGNKRLFGKRLFFRNEGIQINRVIEGMIAAGIPVQ